MGVVVAAVHIKLGQRVAVKFLLPSVGESAPIIARFEREARAAVALHSEHVTRVLDVGRLPSGSPYMVMEMLEGTDLAHELRKRKRLPAHEAAAHIVQACDALAEAHALGIIHRDIKPANLFLAQRPNRVPIVKVLDFGISKANTLGEEIAEITRTTELIGSPLYMSPEQLCAPKTVDARSDVWSLGATLYELVSGHPPFDGATMAVLSANILMTPLADVRSRSPGVEIPDALASVIARCLEKKPENRYPSADALALALGPIARMEPGVAAPTQNPMATTSHAPAALPRGGMTLPLLPGPSAPSTGSGDALHARAETNKQAVSEAAVSYRPPPSTARPSRKVPFAIATVVAAACAAVIILAVTELSHRSSRAAASASPASPPSVASVTALEAPPLPSASAPSAPASSINTATAATAATAAAVRAPIRPAGSTSSAPPGPSSTTSSRPAPSASVAPKGSASPLNLKLE